MASSTATASAIGTNLSSPRARLEAPTAVTKRISSVAYAVEEIGSDEKVASAMVLGRRWWSASDDDSGRPTRRRLAIVSTRSLDRVLVSRRHKDGPLAVRIT